MATAAQQQNQKTEQGSENQADRPGSNRRALKFTFRCAPSGTILSLRSRHYWLTKWRKSTLPEGVQNPPPSGRISGFVRIPPGDERISKIRLNILEQFLQSALLLVLKQKIDGGERRE